MVLQAAFHHRTGWVKHTSAKRSLQSLFYSAYIHELDVTMDLRRYVILYVFAIGSRKDDFLDTLAMSSQYLTEMLAGVLSMKTRPWHLFLDPSHCGYLAPQSRFPSYCNIRRHRETGQERNKSTHISDSCTRSVLFGCSTGKMQVNVDRFRDLKRILRE